MSARRRDRMLVLSSSSIFVCPKRRKCPCCSYPSATNAHANLYANVYPNLHPDVYTITNADFNGDCDHHLYAFADAGLHPHLNLHPDANIKRDANGHQYTNGNVDALKALV